MVQFLFRKIFARRRSSQVQFRRPVDGAAQSYSPGGLLEARVTRVKDGDGVVVFALGKEIEVRLDSVDSPEYSQPGSSDAVQFLARLINGRHVYLETHGTCVHKRTLATVYVMEGSELINVNAHMVMNGHAWVYAQYYGHLSKNRRKQLHLLERWARSNKKGVWKSENPIPPWDWRKHNPRS